MHNDSWFTQLSLKQRIWFFATAAAMLVIIAAGISLESSAGGPKPAMDFNTDLSIKEIAPALGVTGKALARELKLPLTVS
jgi:hypothetical protein